MRGTESASWPHGRPQLPHEDSGRRAIHEETLYASAQSCALNSRHTQLFGEKERHSRISLRSTDLQSGEGQFKEFYKHPWADVGC